MVEKHETRKLFEELRKEFSSKSLAVIYMSLDGKINAELFKQHCLSDFSEEDLLMDIFGKTESLEIDLFIVKRIHENKQFTKNFIKRYVVGLQDKVLKKHIMNLFLELKSSSHRKKETV